MTLDSSYCFVCGSKNPKSLKIKVFYENGIAKTYYSFPPEYQGWKGFIHGGIIATLLDEIMAYAAGQLGPTMTIHLNITFRQALHPNEKVIVSGWIENKTNRKVETKAEMRRIIDNKIIATAEGVLLFVK
ncbi:MAG TPA: PaaI family thioesterase [Candidatus Desulfofervidus auxilii]|uniref:Acyl-coenzyme A thioesterase THEM4 n=1 Tax=Desulfofervidus auxilii TaxID=1621989 RepID=A0A7C0U2Q0_DESA2|nr:PaaI family thioesterase [Candidatus Desulfofervidus auxilii]HDD44404.1 PaaI family thioesterase [Candidatus Desulfofervidus auxilii]